MPKREVRMSAVKTHKHAMAARLKNRACRNAIWTLEKKLRAAVEADEKTGAQDLLKQEYSLLDKAVKYGTLHRNAADRKKSRLASFVAAGKKAAPAPAAAPAAEQKKEEPAPAAK